MAFQNIGTALALLRQQQGLSQAELADSCEIGRAQLSRYEAGKELMKLPTLDRLLSRLSIEPEDFFRFARSLSASTPRRRAAEQTEDGPLTEAFQNLHEAIDQLRHAVERSIDPAARFARLIDEAAGTRAVTPGLPAMPDLPAMPGAPGAPER